MKSENKIQQFMNTLKKKSESAIQQSIVVWYRNNNLTTDNLIFSVPNESSNAREQMYKKSIGMLSGVSDLICIHNGKVLFIEVKDDKGKQSDNQRKFEQKIIANGFEYHVVRSLDEFKPLIK